MVSPAFSAVRLARMRESWTPSQVRELIDDYEQLVHAEPADEHERHAKHLYSRSPRVPGTDAALGEAIRLVCGHVPELQQESARGSRRGLPVSALSEVVDGARIVATVPGFGVEGADIADALRKLLRVLAQAGQVAE